MRPQRTWTRAAKLTLVDFSSIYIFGSSSTIHSAQTNNKKDGHFLFAHTGSPLSILTGFFKITGADGEGFSTGAFETTPGEEERVEEAQETPGENVEESSALTKDTS